MARDSKNLIVGLDIGTTKVCVVIGQYGDSGQLEIVGVGTTPSRGLRRGVVINIEKTVESIKEAIEEAETMAGCEIRSVYAGVGGGQTKVINSQGIIAIKDREVTPADMERVIARYHDPRCSGRWRRPIVPAPPGWAARRPGRNGPPASP